jgi:hypothetical protein
MEKETKVVNVKVKYIRPAYADLEKWMENPDHVYIGRPGIVFIRGERFPKTKDRFDWGNPFKDGDNCLVRYEEWLRKKIEKESFTEFTEELKKLKGKTLGCWCKPERCHGDVLKKVLDELD